MCIKKKIQGSQGPLIKKQIKKKILKKFLMPHKRRGLFEKYFHKPHERRGFFQKIIWGFTTDVDLKTKILLKARDVAFLKRLI